MLIKFTVSNYKNFNKPICLDLTSTHDYRFGKECIKDGVISKAIVYGKNSSGKSNLGYALFDIVNVLTNKNIEPMQINPASFLNADNDEKNARFEYVFEKDGKEISFIYEKSAPQTLAYEELSVEKELIYSYDFINKEKCFENLDLINANGLNLDYLDDNLSLFRYIANNTKQPKDSLVRYVMNFVSSMEIENTYSWIVENNLGKEFSLFLRDEFDIDRELIVVDNLYLVEKHKNSYLKFLDVEPDSIKSLALFFYLKHKEVSLLFIDDFGVNYDYELGKKVVLFVKRQKDIQCICASSNTGLVSNELLRPDCYFILNNSELRSFADSTNRELREGHNLEKMLRSGEFN